MKIDMFSVAKSFFESSGEWVDVMLDDYCSGGERRCYEPVE